MLAFHGDKAISGPDAMCLAAIKRGMLCVDVESGKAWSVRFANNEVGCTNAGGYRVFTLHLDGKRAQVKIHRLIWLAAQGAIPDGLVIDLNAVACRVASLEEAGFLVAFGGRRGRDGGDVQRRGADIDAAQVRTDFGWRFLKRKNVN